MHIRNFQAETLLQSGWGIFDWHDLLSELIILMVPEKLFHDFMIEIEGELLIGMEGGIDHSGKSHLFNSCSCTCACICTFLSIIVFLISSSS